MVQPSIETPAAAHDDLAGLFSRFRRHIPLVLAITAVCVGVAAFLTSRERPRYTASALVLYQPAAALAGPSNQSQPATPPDQVIETQGQVLRSPSLAAGVVERLQLQTDPTLNPTLREDNREQLAPAQVQDAVIEEVMGKLRTQRMGLTSVFRISFTDRDPVKAARIANAFAETYIQQQMEAKRTQLQGGGSLLTAELDELRQQADAAESAVQGYKVRNNLVSAGGATIAEQEVSSLNQQLAVMRAEEAEAVARLNAARRQAAAGGGGDVAAALDSPTVNALRQQRATASRNLAELTTRYGDRHPEVLRARQAVTDMDAGIQEEVSRILSNLEAQATIARERRASLERSVGGARGALLAGAQATVGLSDLERTAAAARDQYQTLLARARQTQTQGQVIQPDAQITSPATPPLEPSSPNTQLNLLLGLVFGLSFGVGAAFVRHQWTAGLDSLDDVERHLGLPYYGSLPTVKSSISKPKTQVAIDAVLKHPLSSFAEAFRNLAASATYSTAEGGGKLIGITSALPQEGKTTASVCLARVVAMSGKKVLLIDSDLRRRSTTEALKARVDHGLIEVLEGKCSVDEAILLDEPSGAHFLPLGVGAHLSKSPFSTPEFDELLTTVRAQFDLVIFDTAPILAVVDTRVLAPKLDVLIMLVRWRSTPAKASRAAVMMLESVGAAVSGVALSLVNLKAQAQSRYGDAGSYYYKMSKYYTD